MSNNNTSSMRKPARASVDQAIKALADAGVDPYHIRYDRRNDVVFAMKTESVNQSPQREIAKGDWSNVKVRL